MNEELFSDAHALATFVHVKVKDAERLAFVYVACIVPDEQLLRSDLEESSAGVSGDDDVELLVTGS